SCPFRDSVGFDHCSV
ncbi:hypothetical protein VCHENC02_3304B, partial [Vibrio harveyi]